MFLQTRGVSDVAATFGVEVAGQVYTQAHDFAYRWGNVKHDANLSIEVDPRIYNAWCNFLKYTLKQKDWPSAPLVLTVLMLKAEVIETILYGYVTWSPNSSNYEVYHAHQKCLTLYFGWQKQSCTDHPISLLNILVKTRSESIEVIQGIRRIQFAGFMALMEDKRLSNYCYS